MRTLAAALVSLLLMTASAWAQQSSEDQIVELKSGDKVVVRADGTMAHYDSAGNPVPMAEGVSMTAKDGSRLIMKDQSLWREVLEAAANAYGRATSTPYSDGERIIELGDGGRVVVSRDGDMAHYDSAGNRVAMKDGQVMTAKDGSRILMTNGAAWRETTKARSGAGAP